jgi:pyruvate,orthophosphate dikinase
VFTARAADAAAAKGEHVLWCRTETSPEDIVGMKAAVGILTARGGMTSHAAVVARGMGKPCITGATGAAGRGGARPATVLGKGGAPDQVFARRRADHRRLDRRGVRRARAAGAGGAVGRSSSRADGLGRRDPDAEGPHQRRHRRRRPHRARKFGAEGIGLCRTEHMFFAADRILAVREMIVANDVAGRKAALAKILPMQQADFTEIFTAMDGLPVTIRLLDPPLHEFLPHTAAEIAAVAADLGTTPEASPPRSRADRGQPDARPPRLSPGDHLSPRSTRPRRSPSPGPRSPRSGPASACCPRS